MEPIRFFDSLEHLEPKCPGCSTVIKYGINTCWDEKEQAHKCKQCGAILK